VFWKAHVILFILLGISAVLELFAGMIYIVKNCMRPQTSADAKTYIMRDTLFYFLGNLGTFIYVIVSGQVTPAVPVIWAWLLIVIVLSRGFYEMRKRLQSFKPASEPDE
jgi:Ca2+/Na+ antiporter